MTLSTFAALDGARKRKSPTRLFVRGSILNAPYGPSARNLTNITGNDNPKGNLHMKKFILAIGALALASVGISGCNISPQVALGIATGCGIATDLQASPVALNAIQSAALTTIVNTCGNPPTTAAAISTDFVQAVIVLQPIVIAMLKTKSPTASKLTALIDQWPDAPADLRSAALAYHTHR